MTKPVLFLAAAALLLPVSHLPNPHASNGPGPDKPAPVRAAASSRANPAAPVLVAATRTRVRLALNELPPVGALLAGAALMLPFVFSTFRTARRGQTS